MLWELEIWPKNRNSDHERVCADFDLLTHSQRGREAIVGGSRGMVLDADLTTDFDRTRLTELLIDPLVEDSRLGKLNEHSGVEPGVRRVTVLRKPGVMDPAAMSILDAARDARLAVRAVRTFRRYRIAEPALAVNRDLLVRKVLANDAIEQVVDGPLPDGPLNVGRPYEFRRVIVPLRELSDGQLVSLSRSGQLALSIDEMKAIQSYYRELRREPSDIELESFAQTWSEHCSHKTLKGRITLGDRTYDNLLKETIFAATQEVRRKLGDDDWCVSVFSDNAGVVRFDDEYDVCFKVETHNRPSAIEPYGGANTGLGGVIRDVLGVGLGAKPVANTDVFCFAPPDVAPEDLPPGVLHPRVVMNGVVAGVRDYGNRMGIPTVNGAVIFDERYLANPLVFCGTIGIMPRGTSAKAARPGDRIVAVGGRTGRDGIHGATFSSLGLSAESDEIGGGAVQIGNAIDEKKMLDVLLQARDRGLYTAITDCGAGGFSSAIGEMGAELGADVHLDRAPLKYEGLSYTEIWISEAQERMVLAVPPEKWDELRDLVPSGQSVEATDLGSFSNSGRLLYGEELVGDLDMHFLHEGRPKVVGTAEEPLPPAPLPQSRERGEFLGSPEQSRERGEFLGSTQQRASGDPLAPLSRHCGRGAGGEGLPPTSVEPPDHTQSLKSILAPPSVASKEWIVRQYDHEVQGGSVLKPLVGVRNDGPGDAAVFTPVLGTTRGLAVGCGINPLYGDIDPYLMAAAAIDEAVRNVVAVGADPARIALLDNFCWGDVTDPHVLGSLVCACEACRDVAIAFGMPFISGKDSLNNEYRSGSRHIRIPGTLLISAFGQVPDVRQCVSMDLKAPGNLLFLVGETRDGLPVVDLERAPKLFRALHAAIRAGLVRSCHDLSEGGLAVAAAEMAFAGEVGADLTLEPEAQVSDENSLFSESPTRWLLEVEPSQVAAFSANFTGLPVRQIGKTTKEPRLRIAGANGEWLVWSPLAELKAAWQSAC